MTIGPFSTRPLYLQVKDALVQRIVTRTWKSGTAIPNEIDLSREFGISLGTVRKALVEMESDHLITRQQGRGTFVIDQTADEYAIRFSNIRDRDNNRIVCETRTCEIVLASASDTEAQALRLCLGDPVFRLHYLCKHDNHPLSVDDITLPQSRFSGLSQEHDIPGSFVILAHRFGFFVKRAEEKIGVTKAEGKVADELNVAVGTPLLTLETIVYAIDGQPVEWRRAQCNLGDSRYVTEIR